MFGNFVITLIIRQSTNPRKWIYVPSEYNPADITTRSVSACATGKSEWLLGPSFPMDQNINPSDYEQHSFPMIDPGTDKEFRPLIVARKTTFTEQKISS